MAPPRDAFLTVRKLDIDLSQGFSRHWLGGDAFRTQVFNAQSLSFPVGEKYFIDTVRAALPLVKNARLRHQGQLFIGQEATHSHLHAQYNAHLARQGHRHVIARFIAWRIRASQSLPVQSKLAITMAYEHYTAIFAEGVLGRQEWLRGAQEPLKTLWNWHSAEEAEHKAVAFDIYRALGGGYVRRVAWFAYVSALLVLDSLVQTAHCLYQDATLFKLSTWRSALVFCFGAKGLAWLVLPRSLAYLAPRFSPWDHHHAQPAQNWLAEHAHRYRAIELKAKSPEDL